MTFLTIRHCFWKVGDQKKVNLCDMCGWKGSRQNMSKLHKILYLMSPILLVLLNNTLIIPISPCGVNSWNSLYLSSLKISEG